MENTIEIRYYAERSGKDVFNDWLSRSVDSRAHARIEARINRLAAGNFGDSKSLGQGLSELRIDYGPGFRVYHSMIGIECVLLLCGGDKHREARDIERARDYLNDYKERIGIRET
jgi:putative addiction module killer protein